MKMVLETISFSTANDTFNMDKLIGAEVELIHRYFDLSEYFNEARLFLVNGLTVHGTIVFIDDEGYPL